MSTSEGPAPRTGGRRGRGYFLPGFIALVALLLIGLFVGAGDLSHPADTSLAGSDISSQIALGIQAEESSPILPAVTCPAREPVRKGLRFTCELAGDPGHRFVDVTEVDNRGAIRWMLAPG
jgi:hypothetical protein